ncbi:MAG: thrombospondin type 3 repeat-containing protein [Odoribacter sp.]|nr:thrombospondin type 3 repeat-containing protein [Odoribacter sp.]
MISESLNKSHHSKGEHGYGGIWGGHNASFLYNILAHHKSRNPRLQGNRLPSDNELAEIRNNVIYNWGIKCIYAGEGGKYDIVGNYFKPGAATRKAQRKKFLEVWTPDSQFYIRNNYFYGEEEITANNSLGVTTNKEMDINLLDGVFVENSFFPEQKVNDNSQELHTNILQNAGASYKRDAVDNRIAHEIATSTVSAGGIYGEMMGLIDSQEAVGGYPELKSSFPLQDSDNDGMPDEWEIKNGLNPNLDDSALYTLNKEYTNIEVYINIL